MHKAMDGLRRYRSWMLPLLTVLLIPLVVNLMTTWVTAQPGSLRKGVIQLIVSLIVFILAVFIFFWLLGREKPPVLVPEERRPLRYPGLIVLVSKREGDKEPPHEAAIRYHLEHEDAGSESLRVCWLIASGGVSGSLSEALALRSVFGGRCQIIIEELSSAFDVQEAYEKVRSIYTDKAAANKTNPLEPHQIIADFTGGTKPMSAGMILACQDVWPMQYLEGKTGKVATMPVLVVFRPDRG